jgi:hypothetical protein
MPSRPAWIAVGLCFLLAIAPAAGKADARYLRGVVETTNGKPVPHAEIRVTDVSGTLTSDSGEFTISLPAQLQPGDLILLRVTDWVIIDPFVGTSGATFLPRNSFEPMKVVVAQKGDQSLLSNRRLIQQIVQGATSRISPNSLSSPQPDHFLADQAKQLGFTVEQLESAIRAWSMNVQGPYQKGLAALYAARYPEAITYIQQSIASSENDLAGKYSSLGMAEYIQGSYPAAESALRKALCLPPLLARRKACPGGAPTCFSATPGSAPPCDRP